MALPVNIDDLFNGLETSQKIAQENNGRSMLIICRNSGKALA